MGCWLLLLRLNILFQYVSSIRWLPAAVRQGRLGLDVFYSLSWSEAFARCDRLILYFLFDTWSSISSSVTLGICVPCVAVVYAVLWLYLYLVWASLMPSTWLEEEQKHCWLRTRGQQKKKHSVGLPTTLLKKKIANNFTPIRPTTRINAWFASE